jgi:hypothetical protein
LVSTPVPRPVSPPVPELPEPLEAAVAGVVPATLVSELVRPAPAPVPPPVPTPAPAALVLVPELAAPPSWLPAAARVVGDSPFFSPPESHPMFTAPTANTAAVSSPAVSLSRMKISSIARALACAAGLPALATACEVKTGLQRRRPVG